MIEIEISAATNIEEAARAIIETAISEDCQIRTIFNSVPLIANKHTFQREIHDQYYSGTIFRDKFIQEVKERGYPRNKNAHCGDCREAISAVANLITGQISYRGERNHRKWCRKRKLWINETCPSCIDFDPAREYQ